MPATLFAAADAERLAMLGWWFVVPYALVSLGLFGWMCWRSRSDPWAWIIVCALAVTMTIALWLHTTP